MRLFLILYTLFLLSVSDHVRASEEVDFAIDKVLWNDDNSTLNVILRGDEETIDLLYSSSDDIALVLDGSLIPDSDLYSLSKGYSPLYSVGPFLPKQALIMLDVGSLDTKYYSVYLDKMREIVEMAQGQNRVQVVLFSDSISSIQAITEFNYQAQFRSFRDLVHFGAKSDYAALFQAVRRVGKNYDKIYLLSTCTGQPYMHVSSIYESLLTSRSLRQSQIIPISADGADYNKAFYEYMNGLNVFPVTRSGPYEVPLLDVPLVDPLETPNILTLSYRMISSPPRLMGGDLSVEFTGAGRDIERKNAMLSLNVFDPVRRIFGDSGRDSALIVLYIAGFLGVLSFFGIPLYNRFMLKKYHVFRYGDVHVEGATAIDPLKLSRIDLTDMVVQFGDKVMLLDSWKYIRSNQDVMDGTQEHALFFDEAIKGDIFSQREGVSRFFYPIFCAIVISSIIGLCHVLIFKDLILSWKLIEVGFFNSTTIFSNVVVFPMAFALVALIIGGYALQLLVTKRSLPDTPGFLKDIVIVFFAILGIISSMLLVANVAPWKLFWAFILFMEIGLVLQFFLSKGPFFTKRNILLSTVIAALIFIIYWPLNILMTQNTDGSKAFFICTLVFMLVLSLYMQLQVPEVRSYKVELMNGKDLSVSYFALERALGKEVKYLIGRNPASDLNVKWDKEVKSNHAFLLQEEDRFMVVAEEGEVYVNGVKIREGVDVMAYDEVSFGEGARTILRLIPQ